MNAGTPSVPLWLQNVPFRPPSVELHSVTATKFPGVPVPETVTVVTPEYGGAGEIVRMVVALAAPAPPHRTSAMAARAAAALVKIVARFRPTRVGPPGDSVLITAN